MTISTTGGAFPVRVEPIGVAVAVRPGESLLAAARRARLRWPGPCGGVGVCTQCLVDVVDGADHLRPPEEYEASRLVATRARSGQRLACHLKVDGPVTVAKHGVRRR